MASQGRRTLGRARVIGSKPTTDTPSDSLSPATAAALQQRQPQNGILSPSPSSISLNSDPSSAPETDITSAVALSTRSAMHPPPASGVSSASQMICPICGDDMTTLLQLNRHLDDAHAELAQAEEDEVKTWFKTQMLKAKKFQPLAVLNQKFKGLDVFESNTDVRPAPTTAMSAVHAAGETPPSQRPVATVVDPDEVIAKDHWQRYTTDGTCSDPLCPKRLGPTNGSVNCRHCGKLFCEEHSMYQMKLSRSAAWEPVRGYWARVCETCFKSRPGYADTRGVARDHMSEFAAVRRKAVDKASMEVSRLEKRLTKLTQVLTDPRVAEEQQGAVASYLWKVSGTKSQTRLLEESVVDWEDDTLVSACPFCQQSFSTYTFRRHHCRLCGRVVCADVATACSSLTTLDVAVSQDTTSPSATPEKQSPHTVPLDIRTCKTCSTTLFSRSDFAAALSAPSAASRTFANLKQFEAGISRLLPRFQTLLTALQNPNLPPSPAQLAEATKVRKRLTDAFTQYDVAARRLRDLPTTSPTEIKLQKAVYAASAAFLHTHMLPLKALPKILRHARGADSPAQSPAPHGRSHLSKYDARAASDDGSISSSVNGARDETRRDGARDDQKGKKAELAALEQEERETRETLIVLEEQRVMLAGMLAEARRRRKVEEVESLARNESEIASECARLTHRLEEVAARVRGVYEAG